MKRIYLSLSLLLLVIIGSRAANFKFAFLTDIHITAGDSIPYNDLARSVNQINDTPGIEFVIVSGDITNIGDRKSMEVVKSLLDRLNVEYHIIPGNHETKWSESGVTDFARVFGSERFKFEHDGILFMGVNSGPIIRMADGQVAPQDIDWIKTELDKAGKEKPVIFITHYPLQPGDVDNWYDVTDAIRPYNIRLVMGGHYHKYMQLEYDGIPGILCRSNLRAKEKTGGYSLCEVTPDSIFIYEHKIGNVPTRKGAYSMTGMNYPKSNAGYPRPDYSVNKEFPQVSVQGVKKKYLTPCFLYGKVSKVIDVEEKLQQAYLYDFYGELLNEHQRRIYEDFVFNDLSLGEIAGEEGITRQGVADMIKRCGKKLSDYEKKLHLVEKFLSVKQDVEEIHRLAEQFHQTKDEQIVEQIATISNQILEEL